ncbi:hypothetical protein [Pantoea dispersa]|uniref:hypothetical protein n=1 Tax=Pantoea dispersa TaxID=59814 RepID=UPI000FD8A711|nr:hypothetical protein [Pantoea dispersa]
MKELFDLENVYDEQISPLVQQIIDICNENQIPMVCSFAYKNDAENGGSFCSTALNGFAGRVVPTFNEAIRIIRPRSQFVAMTIMSGGSHE